MEEQRANSKYEITGIREQKLDTRDQTAESRDLEAEQQANSRGSESGEKRAKIREQRAESRKQGADNRQQTAEGRESLGSIEQEKIHGREYIWPDTRSVAHPIVEQRAARLPAFSTGFEGNPPPRLYCWV